MMATSIREALVRSRTGEMPRPLQGRRRRLWLAFRRWRERSRIVRVVRLWRTRSPQTFREKVRYKMLRDHRQLVVTFADKAAARGYVAVTIGARYLPHAWAIVDDPADLRAVLLPDAYVMKPTHGSGAALIVSDRAPVDARIPTGNGRWVYCHVRPEFVSTEAIIDLAGSWVTKLYGQGPNREWVYGRIPRRVIVEELLVGEHGQIPDDYKFFVFHGRCRFVQVDSGRFGRRSQDFFDRDWRHLPMRGGPDWAAAEPPKPPRLNEMVAVAERLGASTDFVRVDLYDVNGRVVFGELTSFPAGGDSPFHPESFNMEFGRPWVVPRHYRSHPPNTTVVP